ncbi:alpha/beta-hydrolase [Aspergillus uvarum CBS 121591]|uniref:Alpha/beta-hydrolase n=1 Tax=Aspergillus uvarum CBS 121591 TaxID=1448315 RepID=A0A319CDA1_9EURO|nr:alpha/beta-hydrolase [Aspergillus uvarum CBS 121591]PYH83796.1 alpha/beta-hydrolase [Aspergillus uvarum CBS 121591]
MEVPGKNPCGVRPFYWKKDVPLEDTTRPPLVTNKEEVADGMNITWDVPVTMRDGLKVYVDVFRPEGVTGKLPIIFTFSPYVAARGDPRVTSTFSANKKAVMAMTVLNGLWGIAAQNPPHLAAFVPWEGFTDFYRDYTHHGGIPETKFLHFTQWSCRAGVNLVEDLIENNKAHPLLDDYHKSKCVQDLSKITTPTYVVADWGDHGMHTCGTLNGFVGISSEDKWLEVHGQKKWRYFFEPESVRRQEAFFQKFLKGEKSEVDNWPRVRLEVRDRAWKGQFRPENEWPLARTQYTKKYLDVAQGKPLDQNPSTISMSSYNSQRKIQYYPS